jgi:ABC-type nickel/cobalt efflux system permease component RcnA
MPKRALAAVGLTLVALFLLLPAPASAHPLGNFTVNQYSGLVVTRTHVTLELVVDMAEIPAFQTRTTIDADGNGELETHEAGTYRQATCADLRRGIELRLDRRPLGLTVSSSGLAFPPGQAGLPTLRLTCRLEAEVSEASTPIPLEFANTNLTDRLGWREVTARGEGVTFLASDVPVRSPSRRLTRYPDDLLSSPLDQRAAALLVIGGPSGRGSGATAEVDDMLSTRLPRGADRVAAAFTDLVARQELTVWFGLFALVSAVALGALHALAPGHGKSVMAAYLVGERGSLGHAALLGLSVTATHTGGVLVLGLVLSGSATFVPDRLYPWLGLVSGALLAAVGAGLLRRAWRRRRPAGIIHTHEHDHRHPEAMNRRTLVALGAAGGVVPSPSALVMLLGAIALGRTWFGVALVVGYGAGMALTLVAAGLLLVRARAALDGRLRASSRLAALGRIVPLATASLVLAVGFGLTIRAIVQI